MRRDPSVLWALSVVVAAVLTGCMGNGDPFPVEYAPPVFTADTLAFVADTLAVREILDSNGLENVSVYAVTETRNSRITLLNLSSAGISVLPSSVGNLTALTRLILLNNRVRKLPAAIGMCQKLVNLYLADNQLESLPEQIGQLADLRNIDVSSNYLVSLPVSITGLTAPALVAYVSGNRLCALPDTARQWLDSHAYDSGWRETQVCTP